MTKKWEQQMALTRREIKVNKEKDPMFVPLLFVYAFWQPRHTNMGQLWLPKTQNTDLIVSKDAKVSKLLKRNPTKYNSIRNKFIKKANLHIFDEAGEQKQKL